MIHAREDYNRIQDPALNDPSLLSEGCSAIAEDEPVMLFRAKDKHFIKVLSHYYDLIESDQDGDKRMLEHIGYHMAITATWQLKNGKKTPDLPKGETN